MKEKELDFSPTRPLLADFSPPRLGEGGGDVETILEKVFNV